ncbi:hypothetical protein MY11210_008397 [Beauveria gryllotalpidicola]
MYKYPTPAFGAASFAAAAAAVEAAPAAQDHDAQSKPTDIIRGFAFQEGPRMPVKELTTKTASISQTSSLQELGRLAASASPYNNVSERLKTQIMKDLATKSTSVFVLSPDGKSYQEPVAKELLYKFALKISNLQELYQKKKLTMDPYDFYRWAICKNLKSDLHSTLDNSRKRLKGIIRTMGDDGGQADQGFRAIVLYWASLTGNENKFGKNKVCRSRELRKPSTQKTAAKLASNFNYEKVDVRGRELAHAISHAKERDRKRRELADREANRPRIYGGVNAHRAERGISK